MFYVLILRGPLHSELMQRYFADDSGRRLVQNFLQLVVEVSADRRR